MASALLAFASSVSRRARASFSRRSLHGVVTDPVNVHGQRTSGESGGCGGRR
jgi:hypothetical protein